VVDDAESRAVISSLPYVYCAYLFVTVTANLQVASPWMVVFPFYALVQVLVMPVFGALTYFELAWPAARRAVRVWVSPPRGSARDSTRDDIPVRAVIGRRRVG
jgi:hypothetical protein